jgi:hypothetical protein
MATIATSENHGYQRNILHLVMGNGNILLPSAIAACRHFLTQVTPPPFLPYNFTYYSYFFSNLVQIFWANITTKTLEMEAQTFWGYRLWA